LKTRTIVRSLLSIASLAALFAIAFSCGENKNQTENLVGAWKGKVQFRAGEFAAVKDLEFMRVFNLGGTMTESSNYDGEPDVPHAYGIWKKTGDKQYEARYEFYFTKIPDTYEDVRKAGGFPPAGHGVLIETITLSDDGKSYKSTIKWDAFDQTSKQINSGDEADAEAKRMGF
jgi:hypothetical protein